MGILDKLTGKTKLKALEEWRARVEELEQQIEQDGGRYSELTSRVQRLNNSIDHEAAELAEFDAPRLPNQSRIGDGWKPAAKAAQAEKVQQLKNELKQVEAEHGEWMRQYEANDAELTRLRNNRPGTSKTDIKALAVQKAEIAAAIARTETAIESHTPALAEDTARLQSQVDELVAEQDEMAAAVGLGEMDPSSLKTLQANLKKKQAELAQAHQDESLAASAQRGYQVRLEKLQAELAETNRLLREAVSSHVDQAYGEAIKRMNDAQRQMNDAYQDLYAIHLLERTQGTGRDRNPGEITLSPPRHHQLPEGIRDGITRFTANDDEVETRLQKLKAAAGL